MKKLILLIVLSLFLFNIVLSQEPRAKIQDSRLESQDFELPIRDYNTYSGLSTHDSRLKASGDTIWHEDFDSTRWSQYGLGEGPEGWQFFDSTGNDYYWGWSNLGPRGYWTSPNGGDTTKEFLEPNQDIIEHMNEIGASSKNGFMMIESDWYNTSEDGQMIEDYLEMDTWIQTGYINLSDVANAELSLYQYWRVCCSFTGWLSVFISDDYDEYNPENAHWVDYDCFKPLLAYSDLSQRFVEPMRFNIKPFAGSDSVVIRFHKKGLSHYYWIIDDILISKPPAHDLVLERAWWDYGTGPFTEIENYNPDYDWSGGYTSINILQRNEFVSFRAAVMNFGSETQNQIQLNVVAFFDEKEIYNEKSEIISLQPDQRDTLIINENFVPSQIGNYMISSTVISEFNDQNSFNNSVEYNFQLDIEEFSRSKDSIFFENVLKEENIYYGADGEEIAVFYELSCTRFIGPIKIKVFIGSNNNSDQIMAIENGDFKIQGIIYGLEGDELSFLEQHSFSEEYVLQLNDTNSFIEFNYMYGDYDYIETGKLFAAIKFITGNPEIRFEIGNDNISNQPASSCIVKSNELWYYSFYNPAISILIEPPDCLASIELIYDPSGWPDFVVNEDSLFVSMSYDYWTEPGTREYFKLNYNEVDGLFYSGTIRMSYACMPVQYRYFKNAGWNNPEMYEKPYREFIPDCSGIVHNDSYPISINENRILIYKVFPNPTKDFFTISNLEHKSEIRLYNSLGKEFSINPIHSSNEVKINVSHLPDGIYFLKINNETHKIIKN
jgi:Secretion system C-terminal sorting domain